MAAREIQLSNRSVAIVVAAPRGCGGIGRSARFRSVWGKPRGGSSPLIRTSHRRPASLPARKIAARVGAQDSVRRRVRARRTHGGTRRRAAGRRRLGRLHPPAGAPPGPPPFDDACAASSPSQAPCTGADKLAESAAAECRRIGVPEEQCVLPLGHEVSNKIVDAYPGTWLHRAAAFQYRLGGPVPLLDAQWLGTHNSFNSVNS